MKVPYALGEVALAILAYFIQQRQTLQIVLASLMLSLSFLFVFMPESPRWLIEAGRANQAFVVLNKGAKMNKKALTAQQFEKTFGTDSNHAKEDISKKKMGFQTLSHCLHNLDLHIFEKMNI